MPEHIARRTAISALGSLSVAVAAGVAHTARAQNAPLRVGLLPIFDVAPFYAAQQQGYYAAEGVAVDPIIVRGGAAGIPALAGGSLDIIYSSSPSVVLAISRGIDLRIILQGILIGKTPPDPGAIVKRKGDLIKTGKDLEGKVVTANALRDLGWMFVEAWIKKTGGDTDKVQVVEVAIPAMAEALKAKRVDAAFILDPFMTIALSDPGLDLVDWPMSKVFADGPAAFYGITPQVAAQRPNDVRAFVRAYKRGAGWVNANLGKEALFSLIAGYSGMNLELVRRIKMPAANAQIIVSALPRVTALMNYTGVPSGNVDLRTKIFT